jgi:thioredoxin reductase
MGCIRWDGVYTQGLNRAVEMNARTSPADFAQYDVVVIGGGPAGLSAALYLGRSRQRTLVLDAGKPRNAPSPVAHGVFSRDGAPPGQLLADARQQLARYPTVEFRQLEATRAEVGPLGIVVRLAGGTELRTRRLLFACGVRDELPSIEGLAERWGRTVLHCTYCHGYEMADEPLALYARGKGVLKTVSMLWQLSQNLLLCSNGPADLAEEERRALARRGIRLIETPLLRLGGVADEPLVLHFADGSTETRSALFLSAPVRAASALPQELGCEFDGPGRLVLKDWRTTVPGVYAAGDLATTKRQVAIAAASGVEAAMALNEDLVRDDAVFAEHVTPNGDVALALCASSGS